MDAADHHHEPVLVQGPGAIARPGRLVEGNCLSVSEALWWAGLRLCEGGIGVGRRAGLPLGVDGGALAADFEPEDPCGSLVGDDEFAVVGPRRVPVEDEPVEGGPEAG